MLICFNIIHLLLFKPCSKLLFKFYNLNLRPKKSLYKFIFLYDPIQIKQL